MTFKDDVFALCKDVAVEFNGWAFVSGTFKNKLLKHTDLHVHPGFGFEHGSTPLQPGVMIYNKRSMNIYKKIFGRERSISHINFQEILHDLEYMPEKSGHVHWILKDKELSLSLAPVTEDISKKYIDITEVRPVLVAMMKNGISIIEKYYDLSSEENLLRNLPPKYTAAHGRHEEMEMQKGVMYCITRIMLGDFDFIEYYRSDAFKTEKPKRIKDLDAIIAVLPELKRRYEETGSVI